MSEVSRREVFRTLTVGAAVAAGAATAQAATAPAPQRPGRVPAGARGLSSETAKSTSAAVERRAFLPVRDAVVMHCRSWDSSVYLFIDERTKGFVQLSPNGFAIAAACQGAERVISAKCWGYDPAWGGGSGRFEGALVAFEASDLPGEAELA